MSLLHLIVKNRDKVLFFDDEYEGLVLPSLNFELGGKGTNYRRFQEDVDKKFGLQVDVLSRAGGVYSLDGFEYVLLDKLCCSDNANKSIHDWVELKDIGLYLPNEVVDFVEDSLNPIRRYSNK